MALSVPLSRFTSRVGGGSALVVRHHTRMKIHLHIGNIILVASFAIALGIVLVGGFCVFAKVFTGWKALTRRFPVTDIHRFGKKYTGQTGYFNRKSWNRPFCLSSLFSVELAQEGLLVTALFARNSPLLILWDDIRDVDDSDVFGWPTVLMTADYERGVVDHNREVIFSIPKDALTVIQANVPADRLHKTGSLSQLIKNRMNQGHDA